MAGRLREGGGPGAVGAAAQAADHASAGHHRPLAGCRGVEDGGARRAGVLGAEGKWLRQPVYPAVQEHAHSSRGQTLRPFDGSDSVTRPGQRAEGGFGTAHGLVAAVGRDVEHERLGSGQTGGHQEQQAGQNGEAV